MILAINLENHGVTFCHNVGVHNKLESHNHILVLMVDCVTYVYPPPPPHTHNYISLNDEVDQAMVIRLISLMGKLLKGPLS